MQNGKYVGFVVDDEDSSRSRRDQGRRRDAQIRNHTPPFTGILMCPHGRRTGAMQRPDCLVVLSGHHFAPVRSVCSARLWFPWAPPAPTPCCFSNYEILQGIAALI